MNEHLEVSEGWNQKCQAAAARVAKSAAAVAAVLGNTDDVQRSALSRVQKSSLLPRAIAPIIAKIETRRRDPTLEVLGRLTTTLGMSPADFFSDDG